VIGYDKYEELINDENNTIILDANIFLELYRLSTNSSKDILNLLCEIEHKVWIPKQVYEEYYNNKDVEKRKQHNKYKNIKIELNVPIQKLESDIKKKFYRYRKFHFPNVSNLENDYKNKVDELRNMITEYMNTLDDEVKDNNKLLKEDKVEEYIEMIKDNDKVGKGFDIVDKIKIVKEGETRYKYHIPPGYEDAKEKSGLRAFGDLFVWKEIIRYSSSNNGEIIFITNDEKPDWWEIENDKLIGPRKELIEEFKRYNNNKNIHFLTLRDFYSSTSKYYNVLSYITELELNAERYVEEHLIKEVDEEITDTIAYHEYNYESYIDYSCNDSDVSYVDYEVKDVDFEVIEKEAVYYVTLEGIVNVSLSHKDEEDDEYDMGSIELKVLIELDIRKTIDVEKMELEEDTRVTVDSFQVIDYEYKDPFEEEAEARELAEADMMDALEEYYRH
jgi:hypothetical protein